MEQSRIEMRDGVMGGKPVIRGTRLSVAQILQECAAGLSPREIIAHHPFISEADVAAALTFAASVMNRSSAAAE